MWEGRNEWKKKMYVYTYTYTHTHTHTHTHTDSVLTMSPNCSKPVRKQVPFPVVPLSLRQQVSAHNHLSTFIEHNWRRKWQPTPGFLPRESRGQRSLPGGLLSVGSHRVRHDWSDLACMHALEKEMATHSSVLAWRIPGTREPGGLPSMGSHRVGHDWSDLAAAAAAAQNTTDKF